MALSRYIQDWTNDCKNCKSYKVFLWGNRNDENNITKLQKFTNLDASWRPEWEGMCILQMT